VNERVEFSIGSKIEQSARSVVGSGGERVSVGEEPARGASERKKVFIVRIVCVLGGRTEWVLWWLRGEERMKKDSLNGVDVGFVSSEGLNGFS